MKRMLSFLLFLMMLNPCFAYAQTDTYVYGGSEFDTLGGIAVSGNDRIVMTGVTHSSDGTLSSRTKKGQCGWVLCVDGKGQVLWNFCRHTAEYERMEAPVFREDGSVTVLYWTEQNGIGKIELITLSADVEMLSITPIIQSADKMIHVGTLGHDAEKGYVITEMNKRSGQVRIMTYDLDGRYLGDLDEYPEVHSLPAVTDDGTRISILYLDQNAGDVLVTFERPGSDAQQSAACGG